MTKVTLDNVASLIDATTAQTTINDNSAAIVTAVENTLSRDGTAPNKMSAVLDMDSNSILNLPAPLSSTEPLRLIDANTLNGGGTIQSIPAGGTTGQTLTKDTAADYDVSWTTQTVTVGNVSGLGTGVGTFLATPTSANLASAVTNETGTGSLVFATSPTLVTPVLGTPTSATLTNATGLPITTGVSGLAAGVATFLGTPSSANLASAVTGETGSGALVFGTSPTLVTPTLGAATATSVAFSPSTGGIVGTTTNNNATAGFVGEMVTATSGNVSLTTATPTNISSIVLSAGDWDIEAAITFTGTGTTQATELWSSINTVTATNVFEPGQCIRLRGTTLTDPLLGFPTGHVRASLTGNTTYYLNAQANFSVSTLSAKGTIHARRIR